MVLTPPHGPHGLEFDPETGKAKVVQQDNVTRLQTAQRTNQEASIEVLERMLQLAKDGKVAAVAVAFVRADRVSASWSWSSSDCAPAVVGAVTGMSVALSVDAFMQRQESK